MAEDYKHIIDLADRVEAYLSAEMDVSTEDAAIASQVEHQTHWLEMGSILLGARELGETEDGIIPSLDICLNLGAAESWRQKVKSRKVDIQVGDNTEHVRETVGVGYKGDPESYYVWYDSPQAADQAEHYVLSTLIGHLASRLCILAYHNRDLTALRVRLTDRIDEVFASYSQKPKDVLVVEMGG